MTVYLSRIGFNLIRSATQKSFSVALATEIVMPNTRLLSTKSDLFSLARQLATRTHATDAIVPTIALENATIPLKKKVVHKKASPQDLTNREGHYLTMAYATANSYDLKGLKEALVQQKLYEPGK